MIYGSEDDLCWVFVECQEVLDNNLKIVEYNVISLCELLVVLLLVVGDCELVGGKVVDKQVEVICQWYVQLWVQQCLQVGFLQQQQVLKVEIDSMLQCYCELKGVVLVILVG